MKRSIYILHLLALFTAFGCGGDTAEEPAKNSSRILLSPDMFAVRVIDEDNPENEQTINNLTVLLTDPSSDIITHRYVRTGFASFDDYKLVTLPDNPAELGYKDIYVMTNYGSANFNSLKDLNELAALKTPAVTKNAPLTPETGFCMYGKTLNHDFNNAGKRPALVYIKRSCAKYRLTLTFPENPSLSTNNRFLIRHAASYTYIVGNSGNSISAGDYFDYARETNFIADGNGAYVNTVYLYEADDAPQMYLYTNMNNSPQTYISDLPKPVRNYFYDILIQVWQDATRSDGAGFRYKITIKTCDGGGNIINNKIIEL